MGKPAAGVFGGSNENTLIGVAVDVKSFCQNGRTVDVCVQFVGSIARGVNLAR